MKLIMKLRMKLILTCCSCIPLLVMLLMGVIVFPKVPNYQSRTQKLLLLNNGLSIANVLSAMILSDTNKIVLFEMAQLTTEQLVFIAEIFFETGNINDVKALLRARFPERNVPSM